MKKLLVVLLALGLIAACAMTASAADVKFSGMYYAVGVYESNRTLQNTDTTYSRAMVWTRTRIQTVFEIAEGLSFTTRFDAFEKQWGGVNRSSNTTEDKSNSGRVNATAAGQANAALQENIEMEYGYVTFKTVAGVFDIGYQAADEWGTVYADTPGSRPRAKYTGTFGPVNLIAIWEKVYEADTAIGGTSVSPAAAPQGLTNADRDHYILAGIYSWKANQAGLLYKFVDYAATRPGATGFRTQWHVLAPYVKASFGPLYVEAEGVYMTGKTAKYDNNGVDIDKEGYGAYLLAKYTIGPAYVGGQFGYTSGDPSNTTKDKSGPPSTTSWVPCLIFGNANLTTW